MVQKIFFFLKWNEGDERLYQYVIVINISRSQIGAFLIFSWFIGIDIFIRRLMHKCDVKKKKNDWQYSKKHRLVCNAC